MKTTYVKIPEKGKVVLEKGEIEEPGPGELLLEAQYSTLSPGTENALMNEHILPLPQNIGYSMAATVKAVGPDVTDFQVGDPVVTTGQHATYLLMDKRNVTPAPRGIDLEQAAFFNLAHTGMYGIRRSGLQFGEPAVVLGQGLVGALTAKLAQLAGALPVIAVDLDDSRLEISREMGIHHAINSKTNPDELTRLIDSLGFDGVPVVFEATGARKPLDQAFEMVSERGRVVMLSQAHGGEAPQYHENLMMKGASLIGCYINSKPFSLYRTDLVIEDSWPPVLARGEKRYKGTDVWTSDSDIRVVLNLIYYGSLNLKPLISHSFNIDQIVDAYEMVNSLDPNLLGGVICWK
ncbi:MAG: zinc-binding alcohol dehydrogenase [Desulfobacteraceae bacterium]|nr:zinc-binding alcohol dehydrogenase [Desulfobacteraceae bacterium]MCF8094051.1 zinc-binding alcohol dehydrogenase [Desulfobacteraceae bacterium]